MSDYLSTVSLDWDAISWNECKRRISIIKSNHYVKSIEVKMSPLNGYHIYINLFYMRHPRTILLLRRRWKDDPNRLLMDAFWRAGNNKDNCDVMFVQKSWEGVIWEEIPLFLYHRDDYHSQWQIMNLQESVKKLWQESPPGLLS